VKANDPKSVCPECISSEAPKAAAECRVLNVEDRQGWKPIRAHVQYSEHKAMEKVLEHVVTDAERRLDCASHNGGD
jgi:hypothetical protein